MKKLTELTAEQEDMLEKQKDYWIGVGLCTDPINMEKVMEAAKACYRIVGIPEPTRFYKFDSPYAAAIGIEKIKNEGNPDFDISKIDRKNLVDNIDSMIYGQHEAGWISFYDTFIKFGIELDEIKPLIEMAKLCGWWSAYSDVAIFQERPEHVKFDDQDRLHCEDGPAVLYRDGFSVYSWHGTRIPREWIEQKESLTAEKALKVSSVEQRRCACEIYGWNNILNHLNAVTIDKSENPFVGELVQVEIPDIGKEKFLRVKCGTEREFALPVPPDMERASQAQAWLNFTTEDLYLPQVRT